MNSIHQVSLTKNFFSSYILTKIGWYVWKNKIKLIHDQIEDIRINKWIERISYREGSYFGAVGTLFNSSGEINKSAELDDMCRQVAFTYIKKNFSRIKFIN